MGTERKKCAYCGKEFIGMHARHYCSDECRKKGCLERNRKKSEKRKQDSKNRVRKKRKTKSGDHRCSGTSQGSRNDLRAVCCTVLQEVADGESSKM